VDDAEAVLAGASDPEVTRFLTIMRPQSHDGAIEDPEAADAALRIVLR
jgi:hypothetical protein